MSQNIQDSVINLDFFATKNENAKSPVMEIIGILARSVNKYKINYNQLRFIMKRVREKCKVSYPRKAQTLPQMPSKKDFDTFYALTTNPVHKLIFETLEGTGLRIAELANLKTSNIDFAANTIFINQGKGAKD